MILHSSNIETPLGRMQTLANEKGIYLLEFEHNGDIQTRIEKLKKELKATIISEENANIKLLKKELNAYFTGQLKRFTVPKIFTGSEFQKRVWNALMEVPYGETRTYKEQSIFVGDLKAIRAVATANGANKIAILVPCHRIIGSDGSMTGYAGGIEKKKFLLNLEREIAGPRDLFNS